MSVSPEKPICRVAVLATGPSLEKFPGKEAGEFDAVIGVKRAASYAPCDYWVLMELPRPEDDMPPAGEPVMVCPLGSYRRYRRSFVGQACPFPHQEVDDGQMPDVRWRLFSSTAAIAYAAKLGAKEIVCYGVDLAGEADWDGRPREGDWELQRKRWDLVVEQLAGLGVTVTIGK